MVKMHSICLSSSVNLFQIEIMPFSCSSVIWNSLYSKNFAFNTSKYTNWSLSVSIKYINSSLIKPHLIFLKSTWEKILHCVQSSSTIWKLSTAKDRGTDMKASEVLFLKLNTLCGHHSSCVSPTALCILELDIPECAL